MLRAVVGAGPYKGVSNQPDKLQQEGPLNPGIMSIKFSLNETQRVELFFLL